MVKILEGQVVAEKIYTHLQKEIKKLKKKPFLAVILVGNDAPSKVFVARKKEACERIGLGFKLFRLPSSTQQNKLIELIKDLNKNPEIAGIVVQLPLPKHFNREKILAAVSCNKDVDGFLEQSQFLPAVALAVREIIKFYKIPLKKKKIVVVGRGKYVGESIVKVLQANHLAVEAVDQRTKSKERIIQQADILITAVGQPGLIQAEGIKRKVIIIDVGTTLVGGKIVGDVDFASVKEKVKAITPVPGGVGPVTVACLLKNVVEAAKKGEGGSNNT